MQWKDDEFSFNSMPYFVVEVDFCPKNGGLKNVFNLVCIHTYPVQNYNGDTKLGNPKPRPISIADLVLTNTL